MLMKITIRIAFGRQPNKLSNLINEVLEVKIDDPYQRAKALSIVLRWLNSFTLTLVKKSLMARSKSGSSHEGCKVETSDK